MMKARVRLEGQGNLDPLSGRELEILGLMSQGFSNGEIARKLSLSLQTIKWHNKHIFLKLGVGSRTQAVARAVETGVFSDRGSPVVKKVFQPANYLPASMTSFVGRESEIEEVARLASSGARLVTITGSGGIGKTRLAIQVADRLAPRFADGIRWVALAALFETSQTMNRERSQSEAGRSTLTGYGFSEEVVIQAVAKALRIAELPDQPLVQSVMEVLQDKHLLLVLDNCEHLIEASAGLAERIVSACPAVTILATSREALGMPGEKAWHLPSLSLPADDPTIGLEDILRSEAVRLFIERAAEVLPGYRPDAEDAATITQICRRLDGIPLAIELAAARMNLLSVQEIAARLDRQFSLLTGGHRTALPRHQTLRATIEWSYDLLAETEQAMFRRLSIFTGSFTLEAAEAVCADHEIARDDILTLLGRLVGKSLLNVELAPESSDLPTRYRFLDTIRSFGRLKLDDVGNTRRIHERHAAYYVRLVETAEPELLLQNQVYWTKLLLAEFDDIRAVIEWSAENDEAESALRLVGALLWFWFSISSSREGLELALKALSAPSAARYERIRARALNTASSLHWFLGDSTAARRLLDEALAILNTAGDESSLASSKQILGMVLTSEGRYDLADVAMKDGLVISQQLGDYQASVFSLAFRGDIALQRGDRDRALRIYHECADLLQAMGNKIFLAYPLRRLGYLAMEAGDLPRARDFFRESLNLNHEVGDKRGLIACLVSLAVLAIRLGKPPLAASLLGAAESRLELLSINLLILDQIELGRIRSDIFALVDSETLTTAFAAGWKMNDEQAVALALQVA